VPQEERQNAKGLVGQEAPVAISNQLAGPQIQRAVAEPDNLRARRCERHGHLLFKSQDPIRPVRARHFTSVSSSNRPQIIERPTAPRARFQSNPDSFRTTRSIMKTVKKLPRSVSILIVSIVGGALLAGCGAEESLAELPGRTSSG